MWLALRLKECVGSAPRPGSACRSCLRPLAVSLIVRVARPAALNVRRPLAISALLCIDPFRPSTGATTVLPGSHRVERFPSEAVTRKLEVAVEAPAGSFIVFDAMLFHRAGHNVSGAPRRAVNHVYGLPILAQQVSIASFARKAIPLVPIGL